MFPPLHTSFMAATSWDSESKLCIMVQYLLPVHSKQTSPKFSWCHTNVLLPWQQKPFSIICGLLVYCSVSDIKKRDYFKNTHAFDPRWRVHVMGKFKKFLTFEYLEMANKFYSLIILFQEQLIDGRDIWNSTQSYLNSESQYPCIMRIW